MQTESEFIKIAVEIDGQQHLHKLHRTHSMKTVISDICKVHRKNNDTNSYGLKFMFTKDEENLQRKYVTEENLSKLQDGWIVTLEKSIPNVLEYVFNTKDNLYQEKLKLLPQLCEDPGVIEEIKKCNYHNVVPKCAMKFKGESLQYSLESVYNLLINDVKIETNSAFFDFISNIVKSPHDYNNKIVITCLQIINQMLVTDDNNSTLITSKIKIDDITPYLWSEDAGELQLNTLVLLNNIIDKSADKYSVTQKLNENKEKIARCVTKNAETHKKIAHELCRYQTTLLRSFYMIHYEEEVIHEDNYGVILRAKSTIYEPGKRDTMIDFEEKDVRNRLNTYSSGSSADFQRLSRCNSREDQLDGVSLRSKTFSTDSLIDPNVTSITKLTSMCIDYYRKKYEKNFNMSVLETCYNPGFSQICNQIVNMLCDILFISKDPTKDDFLYIPLIFNVYKGDQFFEELFCRTISYLAKTRREMKARVDEDHEKVLAVLKKQLSMTLHRTLHLALHKHPLTFKHITEEFKKITYKDVFDIWEKERNDQWDDMISNSSCIDTVRKQLLPDIKKLIKKQRMEVLRRGEVFPKLPEKKGKQLYWHISLNKNNTKLQYGDYDIDTGNFTSDKVEFHISKIEHIATGKAAKCVREQKVRRPELISRCFSLLFENEKSLDFLAHDEYTAQYWIDGLHLLLGKPVESATYKADLNMLLTMDLNMRLLELQNVPIPKSPPPIPRAPIEKRKKKHQYEDIEAVGENGKAVMRVKPDVPPKTDNLRHTIALKKHSNGNIIE